MLTPLALFNIGWSITQFASRHRSMYSLLDYTLCGQLEMDVLFMGLTALSRGDGTSTVVNRGELTSQGVGRARTEADDGKLGPFPRSNNFPFEPVCLLTLQSKNVT